MSDTSEDKPRPGASDTELDAAGERSLRDMLRGALAEPASLPDLTLGVQKKIRVRSGGKFYADGWSTAKHPPLNTYLMTSLMMLIVLAVVYALIVPISGAPEPAEPSKPVNVVAPP